MNDVIEEVIKVVFTRASKPLIFLKLFIKKYLSTCFT